MPTNVPADRSVVIGSHAARRCRRTSQDRRPGPRRGGRRRSACRTRAAPAAGRCAPWPGTGPPPRRARPRCGAPSASRCSGPAGATRPASGLDPDPGEVPRLLNVRSTAPRGEIEMREIDAGFRCDRHAVSGPAPSTHDTAALIGETWLTTTMSVSAAFGMRSSTADTTLAPFAPATRRPAARATRRCATPPRARPPPGYPASCRRTGRSRPRSSGRRSRPVRRSPRRSAACAAMGW